MEVSKFISVLVGLISYCTFILSNGVGASHNVYLDYQSFEPYRTGFHFQPEKNWMNDPN
ncbi:sucrose:sucrose fructosyltransferase, partial [Sarracenia purpurea var. burkii]